MDQPTGSTHYQSWLPQNIRQSPTWTTLFGRLPRAALLAALLLPILVAASYGWATHGEPPADYPYFGKAGAALLLGRWDQTYHDPLVQAGPFQLTPYGVIFLLGVAGVLWWLLVSLAMMYALITFFIAVAFVPDDTSQSRFNNYALIVIGLTACLGGFIPMAVTVAHPAQVVVPLLWVLAACFAKEDRFATAGVLIGISAGWEIWGILGAPVVLLASHPRVIKAGVSAAATLAVLYLPFVLTGRFQMFGMSWGVAYNTIPNLILPSGAGFPWTLRVAQALIAVAIGCGVAIALRSSMYGVWLVPLAILLWRLVVDPLNYEYYWISPAVVGLLLAYRLIIARHWLLAGLAVAPTTCIAVIPIRTIPLAVVLALATLVASALVAAKSREIPPRTIDLDHDHDHDHDHSI